jgi:gamma-glutamylaminecyclotransferase
MCVIIIKQRGRKVSQEVLKKSSTVNPDGLGIVWLDTFEVTYHDSKEYKKLLTDRPYIAHFRYATVGKINRANTHPFVCGKNTDELLMMNGTITGLGNDNKTDSKVLAEMLGDMPRDQWKTELEQYECRFVSINTKTKSYQIYNRHLYTNRDGVWFSKDNVLLDNVVAVYGTLKKGYSNYYGHLYNSNFVGSGKTKDKYPLIIKGLPFLVNQKGVGHNVAVDVFKVSDSTLAKLDILEGHPRWYKREQIQVVIQGKEVTAWIYFNPKQIGSGEVMHKTFLQKPIPKSFTLSKSKTVSSKTQKECTQLSYFDEVFDEREEVYVEKPSCIDCFSDLEYDGFNHYHCSACGGWFTDNEVALFN